MKATRIADDRWSLELPSDTRPEPVIAELAAIGGELIAVTPLRTTLEDVFMSAVGSTPETSGPAASDELEVAHQ